MTDETQKLSSVATLWGIAGLAGAAVGAIGFVAIGLGGNQAVFVAIVAAVAVGVVLSIGFRNAAPAPRTTQGGTAATTAQTPTAAPETAPRAARDTAPVDVAPAAAPASDAKAEAAPGAAPDRMDAPREGGADDLKKIKGVGPKLESLLNDMGIYHYDQIAGWTDAEIAWVDDNIEGFRGRASRDEWVAQARVLAAGGETEFSARNG